MDFIPVDHLMPVVRTVLQDWGSIWMPEEAVRVLQSCALRGCEEAVWLVEQFTSLGPLLQDAIDTGYWIIEFRDAFYRRLACQDSPFALYYRAHSESAGNVLEQAVTGGFAPAMTKLWLRAPGEEMLPWLRKAAALHDADALHSLANVQNSFDLHIEAAHCGNADSMDLLSSPFSGDSGVPKAVWRARASFLLARGTRETAGLESALNRLEQGSEFEAIDLQLVHDVGRELEGVKQLWQTYAIAFPDHAKSVSFYLSIVHSARRAALQTIVALREFGLPRDLAIMIGRHVYNTRSDAFAWCEGARKEERKRTK